MQIFLTTLTRKTVCLDVKPDDTIERVKEKIFEKEGVPIDQQVLVYESKILENDKILAYYNIQKDSTLKLMLGNYCFIIYDEVKKLKISGYNLRLYKTLFLKKLINEKLGIVPEHQELIVDGKIMENDEGLYGYNVENGKEIVLKAIVNVSDYLKFKNNK